MPTRKRKFNTVGSQKKGKSANPSKRRKLSSTSNKHKKVTKQKKTLNEGRDTEITPYTLSELQHLTVTELQQLLKKQNFPISGRKSKLIERLTKPKETINEIEISYHENANHDENYYITLDKDTPKWVITKQIEEREIFKPEEYIFMDGRIKYKSNFN